MDKYVCVHGHYYQPPRDNPWLEDVELQDSAYPYHGWNAAFSKRDNNKVMRLMNTTFDRKDYSLSHLFTDQQREIVTRLLAKARSGDETAGRWVADFKNLARQLGLIVP